MGGGHEGRRLLVPGQYQLDARLPQRLDDVEILFAGHSEDALHALVRKRCYQEIRTFAHCAVHFIRKPTASVKKTGGSGLFRTACTKKSTFCTLLKYPTLGYNVCRTGEHGQTRPTLENVVNP
jgi:hypothetical protein